MLLKLLNILFLLKNHQRKQTTMNKFKIPVEWSQIIISLKIKLSIYSLKPKAQFTCGFPITLRAPRH